MLIAEENKKAVIRKEYLINMRTKLGFDSEEDYLNKRSEIIKKREIINEYAQTISLAESNSDIIKKEYDREKEKVPESYKARLQEERTSLRQEYNQLAFESIGKYHDEAIDFKLFEKLSNELDPDMTKQITIGKTKKKSKVSSR